MRSILFILQMAIWYKLSYWNNDCFDSQRVSRSWCRVEKLHFLLLLNWYKKIQGNRSLVCLVWKPCEWKTFGFHRQLIWSWMLPYVHVYSASSCLIDKLMRFNWKIDQEETGVQVISQEGFPLLISIFVSFSRGPWICQERERKDGNTSIETTTTKSSGVV